nr:hypothetical protein [uncultured Sulfurimonas sp.]
MSNTSQTQETGSSPIALIGMLFGGLMSLLSYKLVNHIFFVYTAFFFMVIVTCLLVIIGRTYLEKIVLAAIYVSLALWFKPFTIEVIAIFQRVIFS